MALPQKFQKIVYTTLLFSLFINVSGQRNIEVFPVKTLPAIDGKFDDIDTLLLNYNFIQLEPVNGDTSISNTRIIVMQDEKAIYFGIACYQNVPVTGKIQVRDRFAQSDDGIFIILGTFNDNRNAYCFALNPLGTQTDSRIMDDGRTIDYNWDTEWNSSAQIYDWGWFAEMVIPFNSIKFNKKQTDWQINFRRMVREESEISYWANSVTDEYKISSSGKLLNLNPKATKNTILLVPYGIGKVTTTNANWDKYIFENQIGGDINWQINSNLTSNITVNPDFATVEADEDVIDLTKYEVQYPEKRVFFQEGNEMYQTRLKTFYSRRVGDISAGIKLTGKAGRTNINLINAFDKNAIDSSGAKPMYTAFRVKRDILKSSSLGFTATNKLIGDRMISTFSPDYVLNLGSLWKLTGQYVAAIDDWNVLRNTGYARFAAENNFFHWHIRYSYLQGDGLKDIFNETGYLNDDNRNEFDSDLSYKWWIKESVFKYINFSTANNIYWNDDFSKFMSWNINETVQFYFTNKFNLDFRYNNEYRHITSENADYYNFYYSATLGYNTEAYNRATLIVRKGRSFDSDYYSIESGLQLKVFNKLAVEFKPRYIQFSPETDDFKTAFINSISTTYNFTNNLWIKFILQTNSSNDKIYVYGLTGWRFKPPFGYLYFIVNHTEYIDSNGVFQNKYIGFLKLTYPITIR
ncbi:MAG: carbohydrate binding family 9 domain-containing protein [Prolixibacteraceae bacterium]|nr:carbohydrate binding family 9 domain-containing protein [Prolixibacteraceae bacterium]